MNWLNFFTKLYSKEKNIPGLPFWIMTPVRRLTRYLANIILPRFLASTRHIEVRDKSSIIVSFTSFPARIENVWQVVECMLRQTLKPSKILLWLSKEQFPTSDSIPQSLHNLKSDIFEIRMVDGDVRSHKKYLYTLQEYPDVLLFLIDDDIYYPTDILERSMSEFEKGKSTVVCNYGYFMKYQENGKLAPYRSWSRAIKYSESESVFFGSGGGTLICTSKLTGLATDIELALRLTPIADDIWLNAMVRLSGMKVAILNNGNILPIQIKEDIKLASENMWDDKNDKQLSDITTYFLATKGVDPFACS